MLGVAWKPVRWRKDQLYEVRQHVLPDDLEPLYQAGYLQRPEPETENASADAASKPDEPSVPASLQQKIKRIVTHAYRMELARSPDRVFALYLAHIHHRLGWTSAFNQQPEAAQHPEPELGCTPSKAWEIMCEMDALPIEEVLALKPAQQRILLAHKMLKCLSTHAKVEGIEAQQIRRYWTPDAAFFKSYSKPDLIGMLVEEGVGDEAALSLNKKAALCDILSDYAAATPLWLPKHFGLN